MKKKTLIELARDYLNRTERFDLEHCSGRTPSGIAYAVGALELSKRTRFATGVFEELVEQGSFSRDQLIFAIQRMSLV